MRLLIYTSITVAFLFPALPGFGQKYRTADDTIRLNKEYLAVTKDIANLDVKLSEAQGTLPGYQSRAEAANSDAANSASASSSQASKATGGNVKDARKAKRKANKAYSEARNSRSADVKVAAQQKRIDAYKIKLGKKQQRLAELNAMREKIYSTISPSPVPSGSRPVE